MAQRKALTVNSQTSPSESNYLFCRLLKTPHRSTISACRLSSLGLMKINRRRCKNISKSPKDMEAVVLSPNVTLVGFLNLLLPIS
jgi:hypothetical protein